MKPIRNGKSDRQRMDERHYRNLNPHAPARAAMWLFAERYAAQRGGSMDFWDSLDEPERRMARNCAKEIRESRVETRDEQSALAASPPGGPR